MTDKEINIYYGETTNYTDPDAFASDISISLLNPDDLSQKVNMDLFEQLRILWHVANDPFKSLLERIGYNQTQCAIRFCIPRRTIQDWAGERRAAPLYIRLMMAEATGLLNIRSKK